MKKKKPISIENRWDILYRDYPEVYDEFSSFPYHPTWHSVLSKKFNFKNKLIVDIGSGSGKSTFGLALYAKYVIGVEPEDAMRELAIEIQKSKKIENIEFKKGSLSKIPLQDNSVDAILGITTVGLNNDDDMNNFITEASRVLKHRGYIIMLNIAPGWYGGNLEKYIRDEDESHGKMVDDMYIKKGFDKIDFFTIQDYQNPKNMIDTYGFIFGKLVIQHIKENNLSKIKWKLRVRYKQIK